MKLVIKRFKNIKNVELDIAPITLLIGGNNSGKSSILQAIQFAVSVAQTTEKARWIKKGDRLPTSISPTDLTYSPLRNVSALAPDGNLKQKGSGIKITIMNDGKECTIAVSKGNNKNISVELIGKSLGQQLQSLENPYCIFVPGLAGIPESEGYETPPIVKKAAARGDSNRVLRNILWLLHQDQDKTNWNEFTARLKELFPSIDIDIEFCLEKDEHIRCNVLENYVTLPIDSCGTGVLQAIQILSYVSLYRPRVLLLDEPDSHLHPNNQSKLATMLRQFSGEGITVLVSTHSLHLISALMGPSTKTYWIRNGEIVPDADDYEMKALAEIGALNEGADLKKAKVVVLTEDEDKDILKLLLNASGIDLSTTEIWSYNGCSNIPVARSLAQYIKKHNVNCKIVVHRDRDCMMDNEVQEYITQIEDDRVYCYIPESCDLESVFISPKHISNLYPEITIDEAESLIEEVYKVKKNEIHAKLINSRSDFLIQKKSREKDLGSDINLMEGNLKKYANGKICLSGLHEILQRRIGKGVNLKKQSTAIKQDLFEGIAREISRS